MTAIHRTLVVVALVAGGWWTSQAAESSVVAPRGGPEGRGLRQAAPLAVLELAPGVRLEIVELKRVSGDLLHLTFAIDNQTADAVNPRAWGIIGAVTASDYGPTGVVLLDMVNLKRHRPGNYTLGRDLSVAPGSRREYWAQYAAPPPEVKEMTIQIPDGQPMYDVPISG